MAEMLAACSVGENMRQEDSLVDLDAVLVALLQRRFCRDLRRRRGEARDQIGRLEDQLLDPQEARAAAGEAVVDRHGMRLEEGLAARARGGEKGFGSRRLGGIALPLRRKGRDQPLGDRPEVRMTVAVFGKIAGDSRQRFLPLRHRRRDETRRVEAFSGGRGDLCFVVVCHSRDRLSLSGEGPARASPCLATARSPQAARSRPTRKPQTYP